MSKTWGLTPENFVESPELLRVFEEAAIQQYRMYHLHKQVMVPISNAEIAEVLEKAADLLESGQIIWVQGVEIVKDDDGKTVSACTIGLLNLAASRWDQNRLYKAAVDALTLFLGRTIVSWNDAKGRTRDEVIDMFKALAKDLRNEQN